MVICNITFIIGSVDQWNQKKLAWCFCKCLIKVVQETGASSSNSLIQNTYEANQDALKSEFNQ
jgi:hypothetical protein